MAPTIAEPGQLGAARLPSIDMDPWAAAASGWLSSPGVGPEPRVGKPTGLRRKARDQGVGDGRLADGFLERCGALECRGGGVCGLVLGLT